MQYLSLSVFAAAFIFPLVSLASAADQPNSVQQLVPSKFSDLMTEVVIPGYTEAFSRFVKHLIPTRPEFRKWLLRCDQITQPSLRPVGVIDGVPVRRGYGCGFLVNLTAEIIPYGPFAGFVPVSDPPQPAQFDGSLRAKVDARWMGPPVQVRVVPGLDDLKVHRFNGFMRNINGETAVQPQEEGMIRNQPPAADAVPNPVSAGYPHQRGSEVVSIPVLSQRSLYEAPRNYGSVDRQDGRWMPLQPATGVAYQ